LRDDARNTLRDDARTHCATMRGCRGSTRHSE
jgi:hypothetical protein